jgi:hypothetical protein
VLRAPPEGRERTPQWVARLLLPPPLQRVHPPPRIDPSISCRVHKPVVNQVRLPHQVLLGKNQHLQARPDYRHGRGAKDTGDVDQSRLGRRLLLRLCGRCCMDLPGPTTSVGTRTDYLVGPWDYPACAAWHLMAWSTRTTEEKYSVRKLYMSRTVWKTVDG